MGTCNSSEPAQTGLDQEDHPATSPKKVDPIRERFNPFYQSNSQEEKQHEELSKYQFVSNYDDKFLGRCTVLQEKNNPNSYFVYKDLQFDNEQEWLAKFNQLTEKKQRYSKVNDLIKIKEIFMKSVDGFFSDSKKIIMIVEYPLISLKRELNNRIINNYTFSREEITNILFSTIRGYAKVEKEGYKNDKVKLGHILVVIQNKESKIKVIDSELLPESSNLEAMEKFGHANIDCTDIYLAPEEFQAYIQKKFNFYSPKSAVFSLGITILDLCMMDNLKRVYNYPLKKLHVQQIQNYILIAGKKFGPVIEKFLHDMLEIEENRRLSFTELEQKIPQLFIQKTDTNPVRMSTISAGNQLAISKEDNTKSLRSSRMSNTSRNSQNSPSRTFTSGIKTEKVDEFDEENHDIHEQYTNGNCFIGRKKNGLKNGKGKYIFKDKSYYEGQWKNNKMTGKGQLYFPSSKLEYDGEWKNDEYDGWGTLFTDEASRKVWEKYEGEFRNGEIEGRGKMWFKNKVIYDGEFRSGRINGKGRRIDPSGVITERNWDITSFEEFSDI